MYILIIILAVCLLAALAAVYILFRKYRSAATEGTVSLELLRSDQKRMRDFACLHMIQGHVPDFEHVDSFYRLFGFSFPGDTFMVLAAKIRHYPGDDSPQNLADAYAALREELSSILVLYTTPNFAELDGLLVCFYCEPRISLRPVSDNCGTLRDLLIQHCEACTASLLNNHGIDALIAVGKYDVGGFGLHTNYVSAKALLDQAMISRISANVVADASELERKTDSELTDFQRQFYNCFICFKFTDAADYLYQMVELRISRYFDAFQEAREIVAHHLSFCMNMLELPLNAAVPLENGGTMVIRELMASETPEILHENLLRYFGGLERLINGNSSQAAPTTQRIYDYIQQNFADPDISVSSISEHFHLNVSYLSRQFKKEYAIGVLECIHKARIARAKELMSSGQAAGDVFSLVGYTTRRAFDSAFSRYEGVTPKAYQDQLPHGT